jgi:perosamine synthetase
MNSISDSFNQQKSTDSKAIHIPVAQPALVGNERKYVLDCIDSNWISSKGKYIDLFEDTFADFCRTKHAIACTNGTIALHLALLGLNIGPGDEVLVPTMTYIATANAVLYCGATPVLVDSEEETWNIDPNKVAEKITPRTKAIIPVHLYGHPCDMDPILIIAKDHNIHVIEDAAEAHGALYKGKHVGGLSDLATFSFFGNKVVTTGEGGMVTTNDSDLAKRIRQLRGQGQDPNRLYWFPIVGYNYRITNIAAAIGLAQMEKIDWHIARHRQIAEWYHEYLVGTQELILPVEKAWAYNIYWLYSVVLSDKSKVTRDVVRKRLSDKGIETRPFFYPMHILPPYIHLARGQDFPVADRLSANGINLPTWADLTREQVEYVSQTLVEALQL